MHKLQLQKNTTIFRDSIKKIISVDNNFSPNTPPIEFFNMFCDDDFIDAIVYQSNLYNTQRLMVINYLQINGHPQKKVFDLLNQSQKLKLKIFFGIIFYMGVCKYPNRRMY